MSEHASEVCGFMGAACLYRISIPVAAWHRLVTLSMEGIEGIPDWIDFGNSDKLGRRTILTTDPSYFDSQKETQNANTRRDKTGFESV